MDRSVNDAQLDTSELKTVYLHATRGGAYLRLSASAHGLLRAVESGATFSEIARVLTDAGRPVAPAEVEAAYQRIAGEIARVEREQAQLKGGFWLRVRLVPAAWVRRLARLGAIAYRPPLAALLLVLIALTVGGGIATGAAAFDARHFWPGYGLFLAALLAHELGHASACARFGAAPSEIGFLIYLMYPAFYSNVSAAWTLRRWQRVVVDLGGVYFELVFGALCFIAWTLTHWPPLRVTLALIGGSCLLSLNPILKFDGYWVVCDALGVTNLTRQVPLIVGRGIRRLLGRPVAPLPFPAAVVWTLSVYSVVSLGFFAWFLSALGPALVRVARAYPAQCSSLWRGFSAGKLEELATATFFLVFGAVALARIARALLRAARARRGGATDRAGPARTPAPRR